MDSNSLNIYHPRIPAASPLWKILNTHYESFERNYEEKFEKKYGFFRPVIREVVEEYLKCGDLKEGFARVRCPDCGHEYLLAFSCKGRWFCPSCHMKKVVQFGDFLNDTILFPVPHRQYVFTLPIRLRIYFRNDRPLLTQLCHCAYKSLLKFFRTTLGLEDGIPGAVLTIHTFGDFPHKWHPHIHMLVSDGLFLKNSMFYVMPSSIDLKPLEDIFQATILKMLKEEEKINDDIISNLLSWHHSGFSVDNSVRIAADNQEGQISLAQYIIRNTFSVEKLTYNEQSGMVIYHSKMTHGKEKKNFEVYTAEEFVGAITQHIPDKSFQMIRYYGWYSNKSRGMRKKQAIMRPGDERETKTTVEVIDVSTYNPPRIPSKTWRDCIKRIWEVDALQCPHCGGSMKIIAFITEQDPIKKILEHLDLWRDKSSRDPPNLPEDITIIYEPLYDDQQSYDDL